MGGYDVVIAELDSAAGDVSKAVSSRTCYHVPLTNMSAESFGHVELAEWMTTVGEDADTTIREQVERAEQMATGLRSNAATYRTTDTGVGQGFRVGGGRPVGAP